MQTPVRFKVMMPLALALATSHCDIGSVGQTTASPVESTQTTQQQGVTGGSGGVSINTTGAVDPSATSTTGATGASGGTDTTTGTTTGTTPVSPITTTGGTTAGATTGGNGNATTPQNGNVTLFDTSLMTQSCCYYDAQKGAFALSLSNDAQYCAHGVAGVRMMQDHDLAITADVAKQASSASNANSANNTNDTNTTTLAQPTNVKATLSLYDESCVLQSQATSMMGSVTLSEAGATGCSGSFALSLVQTMPLSLTAGTQTLQGTFSTVPNCTTLTAKTERTKCQ